MFTNTDGCTFYCRSIQNRTPVFVRTETGAVYCEKAVSQSDGTDRTPRNGTLIVIPEKSVDFEPKVGDRVVCGIVSDDRCPPSALTVMTVKSFRYGSAGVRHWEVTAE